MRNYDARLARLEKAIIPPAPLEIRVVYVGDWPDGDPVSSPNVKRMTWGDGVDYRRGLHHIAPIATVAPGLLESIGTVDDTPAGAPPAGVDSLPGDDAGRQPALAAASSPGEPEQPPAPPWNFEEARRKMLAEERRGRPRTFFRVTGY